MKITINHIDKIEGHAGFEAAIFGGNVREAFMHVLEGARMVEGMVRGRPYEDIPIITSRICGVCPVVHNLASIKALEAALGIKVDNIVVLFRKLMLLGEIIQSHVLHTFFLSGFVTTRTILWSVLEIASRTATANFPLPKKMIFMSRWGQN